MIRLPDDTHRLLVIGRTGSGKTGAAVWHLSKRRFDLRPWIIFDWKRDDLIGRLGAEPWTIAKKPPSKPGLYVVQPMPHEADDGTLERFLWEVWRQGKTGLYFDEGYMIGRNNAAFRALLTQGRSKLIPLIVLSQRPVALDRFAFSESDFFQVMDLSDKRDRDTVQSFIPIDLDNELPPFHSLWYDVGQKEGQLLAPVPNGDELARRFLKRIGRKRIAI